MARKRPGALVEAFELEIEAFRHRFCLEMSGNGMEMRGLEAWKIGFEGIL